MGLLHWIIDLLPFKGRQQERQKMVRYLGQSILDRHPILDHQHKPARINFTKAVKNQPDEILCYIADVLPEMLHIYSWRENRMIMVSDYEVLVQEIFDYLKQELQVKEVPIS